ncbi:MAG: hypothetical protein JXD22_14050 [Sedimentisphaerales bacterium]|nr:hypothetical protein [Sedimentisphaerales bacterium]
MSKNKIIRRRKFERQENPGKMLKHMTRDHIDVLQNIEFSIVSTFRRCPDIDDRVITSALKTAIADTEPVDKLSTLLINEIECIRQTRLDVPDNIWKNGLKVVLESVHTHSNAQPGDRDYLNFVLHYVV